jgi:hypothetical protein
MSSTRRMAEPNHTPEYNDDGLPERLKAILYALADYHSHLLQKITLETQDPIQVHKAKDIMKQQAKLILLALEKGNFDDIHDEKLKQCLEILKSNNTPYTFYVDTMLEYWCNLMFEEYPFSISHNHIQKLYKNSVGK